MNPFSCPHRLASAEGCAWYPDALTSQLLGGRSRPSATEGEQCRAVKCSVRSWPQGGWAKGWGHWALGTLTKTVSVQHENLILLHWKAPCQLAKPENNYLKVQTHMCFLRGWEREDMLGPAGTPGLSKDPLTSVGSPNSPGVWEV